jgi:hypothetical protein
VLSVHLISLIGPNGNVSFRSCARSSETGSVKEGPCLEHLSPELRNYLITQADILSQSRNIMDRGCMPQRPVAHLLLSNVTCAPSYVQNILNCLGIRRVSSSGMWRSEGLLLIQTV